VGVNPTHEVQDSLSADPAAQSTATSTPSSAAQRENAENVRKTVRGIVAAKQHFTCQLVGAV
jgi:hypothetical protein